MSRDLYLHKLERQRDQEALRLRSHITAVAGSLQGLEQKPAQWIGEHPYLATAGAALLGFAAAQLLPGKQRSEQAPPLPIDSAAGAPPCPSHSAAPPSMLATAMTMLAGLAEEFLRTQSASPPETPTSSIRIASAGVVDGPFFPHAFAPAGQCEDNESTIIYKN